MRYPGVATVGVGPCVRGVRGTEQRPAWACHSYRATRTAARKGPRYGSLALRLGEQTWLEFSRGEKEPGSLALAENLIVDQSGAADADRQ